MTALGRALPKPLSSKRGPVTQSECSWEETLEFGPFWGCLEDVSHKTFQPIRILSSHIQCLTCFSTFEEFLLFQGHLNVISPSEVELLRESYSWLAPSKLMFRVTFPIFPAGFILGHFQTFLLASECEGAE